MGVFGTMNSFSVFLDAMGKDPTMGRPSSTALSFGNSVGVGISPLLGIVVGGLVDRVGPRVMILLSALSMATASVLSSFVAHSAGTLVATYAIPSAIASSLMTSPGIVSVGSWFDKQRAFAMGVAYAGGGAGSCILPVVAGAILESTNDWRVSFRYMALFMLAPAASVALISLRAQEPTAGDGEASVNERCPEDSETAPVVPYKNKSASVMSADEFGIVELDEMHFAHRRLVELLPMRVLVRSLLSTDFVALFFASTMFGLSFYATLFAVIPYARQLGQPGSAYEAYPAISMEKATTLMVYYGVLQIVGSIFLGAFASRINNRYAYVICCGVAAVAFGFFAISRSYEAMAAAVSVIGLAQAGSLAVLPALVVDHFEGPNAGTFVGLDFCSFAIGGFTGAPLVTAIQEAHNGDYTISIAILGFASFLSGMVALFAVPPRKMSTVVPVRSAESLLSKRQSTLAGPPGGQQMLY